MKADKLIALTLLIIFCLSLMLPAVLSAQGLIEQALKVFGISYVVRRFGGQINDFIDRLAGQRGVKWEGTTKVVPIFSVGAGAYVGAAQVQGPPDRVDDVRGVGQVETRIGDFRGRLMIPVNTTTPGKNLDRISGVGISALVDFRI
ncbi:MAG: hypothetical protein ACYC27_06865 [Armatimonadota bacterium]